MSLPAVVIPGQPLASANTYAPGPGTQLKASTTSTGASQTVAQKNLAAAVLGRPIVSKPASRASNPLLSIHQTPTTGTKWTPPLLPAVGMTVYARVTRVTLTNAICSILVLGPQADTLENPAPQASSTTSTDLPHTLHPLARNLTPIPHPFRGIIRPPDVRLTQKDTVVLAQCFRTGDIVRATVISMGDQGGYYLSTAGNEFGVVMAWSERGVVCGPASWREVVEVGEGDIGERRREGRKVARVW